MFGNQGILRVRAVGMGRHRADMEFLTTMDLEIPAGTSARVVEDAEALQVRREGELAQAGHLLRVWMPSSPPEGTRTLAEWAARDEAELRDILESLPMSPWMTIDLRPTDAASG